MTTTRGVITTRCKVPGYWDKFLPPPKGAPCETVTRGFVVTKGMNPLVVRVAALGVGLVVRL